MDPSPFIPGIAPEEDDRLWWGVFPGFEGVDPFSVYPHLVIHNPERIN